MFIDHKQGIWDFIKYFIAIYSLKLENSKWQIQDGGLVWWKFKWQIQHGSQVSPYKNLHISNWIMCDGCCLSGNVRRNMKYKMVDNSSSLEIVDWNLKIKK